MATTVFRRGKAYTGQTKVDRGYTRPQIIDLASASSGSIVTSAVNPPTNVVVGPALCIGIGAADGLLWKKTSAGAGSDWVAF